MNDRECLRCPVAHREGGTYFGGRLLGVFLRGGMNDRKRSFASHFLTEGSHLVQSHAVIDFLSGIGPSAAKADDDQAEFAGVDCGHGAALGRPEVDLRST